MGLCTLLRCSFFVGTHAPCARAWHDDCVAKHLGSGTALCIDMIAVCVYQYAIGLLLVEMLARCWSASVRLGASHEGAWQLMGGAHTSDVLLVEEP
jgi:hypothetical protein